MEEDKQLILHIYPPEQEDSEIVLYINAGDGYGESRLDKFDLVKSAYNLEIHWQQEGNYPFPYINVQLHLQGLQLKQAWVEDNEISIQGQQIVCDRFLEFEAGDS